MLVAALWTALVLVPGALWWCAALPRSGAAQPVAPLTLCGRVLLSGALHVLGLAAVLDQAGVGLGACAIAWVVSLAIPTLVAVRRRNAVLPVSIEGRSEAAALVLGAALLCSWIAIRPSTIDLASDAPAHLGGIHDALASDRLRPRDLSFPGGSGGSDPRFGVAHGAYALTARLSGQDPTTVWRTAPIAAAALFLVSHAWLFKVLGLPGWLAVLAAAVFAVGGAGGRAYGAWSSGYPSQLAVALAALGLAAWLEDWLPREWCDALPSGRGAARWAGPGLVALSALVHPLGWLAVCVVVVHAAMFAALRRGTRVALRPLAVSALGSILLGAAVQWPRLADRGISAAGLHGVVLDALFLGSGTFIGDPIVVAFWCGWGAFWALPIALLACPAFFARPRALVALAGTAVLWTVSFNPWVEPLAWKLVSYLSLRLGRLAWTTAVWLLVLRYGIRSLRGAQRRRQRIAVAVAMSLSCVLAVGEARDTMSVIRSSPDLQAASSWERTAGMSQVLDRLAPGLVATDPRTSYALRARRGGAMPVYPVAHCSPTDTSIADRLALYRSLFQPQRDAARMSAALDSLRATYLLVNHQVERISGHGDFGFVPSDSAQAALAAWLAQVGAAPLAAQEGWELFTAASIARIAASSPDSVSSTEPLPAAALSAPVEASRFQIVGLLPAAATAPRGGQLPVRVWYRAKDGPARTIHPNWERVGLRLQGPSPAVPALFRSVDKLYRKFVLEDSGRSLARFHQTWVPFDGTWPPRAWPDRGAIEELRMISIPPHIRGGVYRLELSIQENTWRTRRSWRDYLQDRDRWSGLPLGTVEILEPMAAPATTSPPAAR